MSNIKLATTVDEQIQILRDRNVVITDEEKAKEVLLDIGYYRLCSYFFPYEENYPKKRRRTHICKVGTRIEDALDLYYFDFDLRRILLKYLFRIEVNIRTFITYCVSNHYKKNPYWYADSAIMNAKFVSDFYSSFYWRMKKDNPVIKEHHKNHPHGKYAPAWKTIEQMPFGLVQHLYAAINDNHVKSMVSNHYGVAKLEIFYAYIDTIRRIRNLCAHGGVIFDMALPLPLRNGPAGKFTPATNCNITAVISVIDYFLGQISKNRQMEFKDELASLLANVKNEEVEKVLKNISKFGF